MGKLKLFEILVPTKFNSGRPVRTKHHKEWDKFVHKLAGGLTLLKPVHGQWIADDGSCYEDRVIPVRIACTDRQIAKIAKFSLKHYKQKAVLYYVLSQEVFVVEEKK